MRAAARCGRPGPGGGRGRGHIWTRRQPPATSWRRRLQAAAAARSCARGGGGDPGARAGRMARPRARAWGGGVGQAPLVRGCAAGPIRTSGEAYSARSCARQWACPVARGRRGGNGSRASRARGRTSSEGGGPGRGRSAPSPTAGSLLGIFLPDLCTVTALRPGVEASAGEGGRPFVPSAGPAAAGVGALRRGSPPLLFAPASEVCAARRRVRSGRARDCRPRPHSQAPGRPRPGLRPLAPHGLSLLRSGPSAPLGRKRGHGWGGAAPVGSTASSPTGPGRPESERPRAGGLPGCVDVAPTAVPCLRERATCWAAVRVAGPLPPPPRPGLPPAPPCCPSPAAVAEASNATSCEDRAHRAPPTVWASQRKRSRSPRPANLALTLTGALTLAPSAPPLSSSPVPSPGWPVRNFLPPEGRVLPGPGRPPWLACPDARSNAPAAQAEPGE